MKSNYINEFLWSCAGVNKEILRLYPSDWAKYAGSGGTILFTAIMAMISGGYAMYFVFSNIIISILFAIVWGLLIFNLDRFIVNSMYTDGKDIITWRKLKSALPRFIMAIFIGIVISTPLEMKIFNDRIESQLLKDNVERINVIKNKNDIYSNSKQLTNELQSLQKQREQLLNDLQNAQKDLKNEAEGNALSGVAGHGAIYKDKLLYVEQCQKSLSEWDKLNTDRVNELKKQIQQQTTNINEFEFKVKDIREDGFSARYEAFSTLKDNNQSLAIVSLMITLLFVVIEITPTFFKLIMIEGPYSEHLNLENYKLNVISQQQHSNYDTELKIIQLQNEQKIKNNILNSSIEPIIQNKTLEKQKTITYGSGTKANIKKIANQKLHKSNLIINTRNKNKQKSNLIIGDNNIILPRNKKGQLILDFRHKK